MVNWLVSSAKTELVTSYLNFVKNKGKTTLIGILTGLFPGTRGKASIYGNDINEDMEEVFSLLL